MVRVLVPFMGFIFSKAPRGVNEELPDSLKLCLLTYDQMMTASLLYVPECPCCHRRLCFAERRGDLWRVSRERLDESFEIFGNSKKNICCRNCRKFEVEIKQTEFYHVDLSPLHFRKANIILLSTYELGLALGCQCISSALSRRFAFVVNEVKVSRSQLSSPLSLPWPVDLFVLVHWCEGQRNPIVDSKGLYTKCLASSWESVGSNVLVIVGNLPSVHYFVQMLQEQPTLAVLYSKRRYSPLSPSTLCFFGRDSIFSQK